MTRPPRLSRFSIVLAAAALAAPACKPAPPDAPEGAEEGTRFLMRSFYADDATVGAGITGLMNWWDTEGAALDGESPELDSGEAADFQLAPLAPQDLAVTQVSTSDRELDIMGGVLGVSTVDCTWEETEALGARADQDVVFDGEWAHYARTFVTDRAAYEAATLGEIPEIVEALEPLDDDMGESAATVMLTSNPLGTSEFGVNMNYTLNLHFRHGVYDVQGVERRATVILTWQPDPTTGEGGSNSLHQTWGIDLLVDMDGTVRRMAATWNDVESAATGSDLLVRLTVNRINRFAERMSEICRGEVELPPEE